MPPILFGPLEEGQKPREAIVMAGAIGTLIASIFAGWVLACPPLRLARGGAVELVPVPNSEPVPKSSDADSAGATWWERNRGLGVKEIRLEVPPHWVRLRQPWAVVIRRWAMAGLVVGAVVALLP